MSLHHSYIGSNEILNEAQGSKRYRDDPIDEISENKRRKEIQEEQGSDSATEVGDASE